MKKLKNFFCFTLCGALFLAGNLPVQVSAADETTINEQDITVIDLMDQPVVIDGRNSRVALTGTNTINNGTVLSYMGPSSYNGYAINKGATVNLSLNLNKSATVEIGYMDMENGGARTAVATITSSNPVASWKSPKNGYYQPYIKNVSSESITVKGGTLVF